MEKETVKELAFREGAENTAPFNTWPKARLPETPEAGRLLRKGDKWYLGVSGRWYENQEGDGWNVYASWREVPATVCADWE